MPRYVIERELPGAGMLSADQLMEIAQRPADNVARIAAVIDPTTAEVAATI